MKKPLLFLFIVLLSAGTARSQVLIALVFGDRLNTPNIEFGVNAGANISYLTNYPSAKPASGLNLGLYFNFKLGDHFYLHPELLILDQLGSRGTDSRDLPPGSEWQDGLETLVTWKEARYSTLVFLPRYKLTNQLYFEAGLHGSLLTRAEEILQVSPADRSELYLKSDIRPDLKIIDAGFDVGLGFKFKGGDGLNLSLRYSYGFINTLKDSAPPPEYNRAVRVHVGIPIGLGKENVKSKLDN